MHQGYRNDISLSSKNDATFIFDAATLETKNFTLAENFSCPSKIINLFFFIESVNLEKKETKTMSFVSILLKQEVAYCIGFLFSVIENKNHQNFI